MTRLRARSTGWHRRAIVLPIAQRALRTLLDASERTGACEEAERSAMEATLWIMRVNRRRPGETNADVEESLRSALGCARAMVVTTGYALVQVTDTRRAENGAHPHR